MVESPATGMHNLAFQRHERAGSRFRILNALELTLGTIFFGLILTMVLWQAASRYIPEYTWAGAGEIARYSLVGLTFILVGYLFGSGQHITISILDALLSPRGVAILKTVAALIVLAISSAFVLGAILLLEDPFMWTRVTSVTRVPEAYIVFIPLAGFSLMMLRAIETVISQILFLAKGR